MRKKLAHDPYDVIGNVDDQNRYMVKQQLLTPIESERGF